jgi:hypothetical protein
MQQEGLGYRAGNIARSIGWSYCLWRSFDPGDGPSEADEKELKKINEFKHPDLFEGLYLWHAKIWNYLLSDE